MRQTGIVLLAVILLAGPGCASAGELPTWKMTELKDLGSGWGPAGEDAGKAYRPALARGRASLTVPVWWGKSFRPPEGTVYVLKVSYKDTVTKPVVFSSHGGFSGYWGLGEVHRFGGAGDGKWKVADVPLSWDLLCRKNNFNDLTDTTEFAIACDKDLPIESIRVVPAGEGAAEKYFAETREWIARAQADKRAKASRGSKQTPVLPASMKAKPIVPYVRSYLVPLMQNAAPQKGEAGEPLKLRMARNEYETAQFAVYANGADLNGVNCTVSELRGPGGKLNCEVALKTAEYAVVQAGRSGFQMFPQRFWPAYPVDIKAGQSHAFWITIKTLGGKTRPGKYAGKMTIAAGEAAAELPIEVEVLPIAMLTMQQAGLELGACGFPTLQELKTLAEYNHTGMDIWFGGTQQQMRVRKGKLEMDSTYLDDWMAYATKLGMTHMMWFMGGDPYGFPDTMNLERDLYRSQEGNRDALRKEFLRKNNETPGKIIPELRDLYVQWVRQTAENAKKKRWPTLIIHPFDEPAKWVQSSKWNNPYHPVIGTGKWIKPHFEDGCALIRQGAKGYDNILTGGDMHHAQDSMVFLDDVDVFCTNAIHEDQDLGNKVRAAGVQFWQYSGCNDQAPAHRARFSFGWYFAAYDSRGSLVWAYNAMGRFDTSQGSNWGYGWYTPFGTVETPFMIGLREGWDDRRWIETYRKRAGAESAKALLQPMFQESVARRSQRGRDTVYDFYAEMQRYERMDRWRDSIIDAVLK